MTARSLDRTGQPGEAAPPPDWARELLGAGAPKSSASLEECLEQARSGIEALRRLLEKRARGPEAPL